MERLMRPHPKKFQFTESRIYEITCRASGMYFRALYDTPTELRKAFKANGLRVPAWDTAERWLNGLDAPDMKRAVTIAVLAYPDYVTKINEAVFLATDEARRTRAREAKIAKFQRDLDELEALSRPTRSGADLHH